MKRLTSNKLLHNALIFTLSTVLNKGLNFFILPILTVYLTKSDYGHLGFIVSVVTIASIYVGLWPGNFLVTKFSSYGKEKMAHYISNIFVILGISFLIVFLIMLLLENTIFVNFENSFMIIVLISFYTLFMVIFNMLNTILQLEKNAIKYAFLQSLYSLTSLSIALLLIIQLHYDWRGKFYAELFILGMITIYAMYYFITEKYIVLNVSLAKLKELFLYLFPMTFHVVGIFLMVTIDKVILAKYMSLEAVGIYTIAMTMSIIVNIVYDSMIRAWEPYFFEKIKTKQAEDMNWIIKSIIIYSLFILCTAFIYIVLIPYIFPVMIDEKFTEALLYIPLLVIAFSLEGLRKPLSGFLMYKNMVKTLGTVSLITAALNIILNIILIKTLGIVGAVYATLYSFLFLYIVTIILVYKYCDIRYTKSENIL